MFVIVGMTKPKKRLGRKDDSTPNLLRFNRWHIGRLLLIYHIDVED